MIKDSDKLPNSLFTGPFENGNKQNSANTPHQQPFHNSTLFSKHIAPLIELLYTF